MNQTGLGPLVADLRHKRGMSQRELAKQMKRSESWVSQVERGVLPVDRLPVLQSLARALDVSLTELRPEALPDGAGDAPLANDLDGLRLALTGHPALAVVFGTSEPAPTVDLDALGQDVEHAWELTHESRLAELSDALLTLLPTLEICARDGKTDPDAVHRLRARAYQAAAAAFASQSEADAAWVAADRAIAAAELSHSPLDVVAGHFRLAHAFLRLHRYDQATRVVDTGISALEPVAEADDPPLDVLSLTGALHLVGAVISARESDRTGARQHLDAAERIATRVGDGRNDFGTEFGITNVLLHRVAVAVDLSDAGEALDVAAGIDASTLSTERQAHLLIDIARAHAQRRDVADATDALLAAEQLAPEQVRSHALVADTIADLLGQVGRRPLAQLADLVRRIDAS